MGVLTSLEPARQVESRKEVNQGGKLTLQDTVEGTAITLKIEPGRVGPNRLTVSLKDRRGNPISNASHVSLSPSYLDADLGSTTLSATNAGDGRYVIEDGLISIAGAWQAALTITRPDAFDARTAFQYLLRTASIYSFTLLLLMLPPVT